MNIPTCLLNAALLIAATDKNHQGRPTLNGVYVEQGNGGAWIVATDGAAIFAAFHRTDEVLEFPSLLLPRDALTAAIKFDKRHDLDVRAATLGALSYAPLDMQYPDWRRVLPGATLSGLWPALFDADLLARCVKAVNVANDIKPHGLSVSLWPDTSRLVVRGERDKCIVLMMAASKPKAAEMLPYEPLGA